MKSPVLYVVDKHPIHRSLIKYHLNVNRFSQVQTFPSGNECIYRLEKNPPPEFLITDYDLGDFSGFDFLRRVKTIAPSVKVVFFASFDDPILAVRLLDVGAVDYIVKTSNLEYGIAELIKNLNYLQKETLVS
ncbi:MAG: response regulator [Bacteroidales bacterium]|nr:response regulator [Bacteroidales bacterium]MDD4604167.1 response regulator [Bacteroidales bacterium]